MLNFFGVPGNRQTLLGMPDIEKLNIFTKHCNTRGIQEGDKDANCSANRPITHGAGSVQCYANAQPETGELESSCTNTNSNSNCYTNTGSNSHLKNSNAFIPMVNNNEIEYFLPAPI